MSLFLVYALALFHGLVVMPTILIGPVFLTFSKRNLIWLENFFILVGGATILSYIFTGSCFLTDWEQSLRTMIDPEFSYTDGFVRFYLGKMGIDFPDLATTFVIGFLVILGTAAIIKRKIKKKPLFE